MRTYTLYLSTLSTVKPPTSKTNLAQVRWNVNWKEIFGNRIGECRVRTRFLSASSNALTWGNNAGSLRASFSSTTTNSANGFVLGALRPQSDYTNGVAQTTYLECDTTTSSGATIIIPNTNNEFLITLANNTEGLMTNPQEFQLWLYFDVDDENPLSLEEKGGTMATMYNPR